MTASGFVLTCVLFAFGVAVAVSLRKLPKQNDEYASQSHRRLMEEIKHHDS